VIDETKPKRKQIRKQSPSQGRIKRLSGFLPEVHLTSDSVNLGTTKVTGLVLETVGSHRSLTSALVIALHKFEIDKNRSTLVIEDVTGLDTSMSISCVVEGLQSLDNRQVELPAVPVELDSGWLTAVAKNQAGYNVNLITTMTSLIIDSYIQLPQAVLDVLDEGEPVFHRVVIDTAPSAAKDTPPTPTIPPPNAQPGSSLIVTNVDKIHSSDHTSVYTAKLDLPNSDELIDVVLKMSNAGGPRSDALWREYQRYEELAKLQGTIIPHCYGLFQAIPAEEGDENVDADEVDVISCLVLGYGGEPSAVELNRNSREFNLSIIKALETFHDAGYTHGGIQPSNVLNNQGTAVLIDLEFVKGDHKCGRKASVGPNGLENKSGDFGCAEIYGVARKMDLWKKSA